MTDWSIGRLQGSRQKHKQNPKSGHLAWISAASIPGHLKSCNSGYYPQRLNAPWNKQLPPRLMFTVAQWLSEAAVNLKLPTWLNSRGTTPPVSMTEQSVLWVKLTQTSVRIQQNHGLPCTSQLWLIWFSLSESVDSPQRWEIPTTRSKAVMW